MTASTWRTRLLGAAADQLPMVAITALAFTQPVLDLYGKNPEIFVASGLDGADVIRFALVVSVAVPVVIALVGTGLSLIPGVAGRVAPRLLFALTCLAYGLSLTRRMFPGHTFAMVTLGAGIAAAIVFLDARLDAARLLLRYLSPAPIVLGLLFVFSSGSADLIWQEEPTAETGVSIAHDAPVLIALFDELPLTALIDADGSIDRARFPNFGRLADGSTWFRNVRSASASTTRSVPNLLTGVTPRGRVAPTSAGHPRNLFTLLGASYEMHVRERFTSLCPASICVDQPDVSSVDDLGLVTTLANAAVVYGHAVLPPLLRDDLPRVDNTWGDFLGRDAAAEPQPSSGSAPTVASPVSLTGGHSVARVIREGEAAASAGAGLDRGSKAQLHYVHAELPHHPWRMLPSGQSYDLVGNLCPCGADIWPDRPSTLQGAQRMFMQAGYVDTQLGMMLDHLEESGAWDDTLVIVVSDHGVGLTEGEAVRLPGEANIVDLLSVPLFIKAPGQSEGLVVDDSVTLTDVLPTIVDILGVETEWEFDGRSLFGDEPGRGDHSDLGDVLRAAQRLDDMFPVDGWAGIAAIGPDAALVGAQVASVPGGPVWTAEDTDALDHVDLDGLFIPAFVTGRLDEPVGGRALVEVNGVAAGVPVFKPDRLAFGAVIDPGLLRSGANEMALLVMAGDGRWTRSTPEGLADQPDVRLVEDEGEPSRIVVDGRDVAVTSERREAHVEIDSHLVQDDLLVVSGWAVDAASRADAGQIVVFDADGDAIAAAVKRSHRGAVNEAFGADESVALGFEVIVDRRLLAGEVRLAAVFDDRAVLRVIALG